MDSATVIFWFVCFACVTGLLVLWTRARSTGLGWVAVYLAILLVDVIGWLWELNAVVYAAAALWLLLVLLPGLVSNLYLRRFLQQRYSEAYWLARIISWLHPADGWRQQPQIIHAVKLAQRGELVAAQETLQRFQGVRSLIGLAAVANLYRITNQWEAFVGWAQQHHQELERHPQFLPMLLRARGETGDLAGLLDLYQRRQQQIGKLVPSSLRDLCRLALFAFGGKRQLVERLFCGGLAMLPETTRNFWLATADLTAGETESAKRQLERLLPAADPPLRLAIERRLARAATPPHPLAPEAEKFMDSVAVEHRHDESFGARRSLFSRHAQVTQILIALNLLMFAAEVHYGGGTNMDALYRLGALFAPAVRAGQWWRLLASLFLHFGPVHLAMNMFGLWILGPFAEFALGSRRFLFVYLIAGIGSMAAVMTLASAANRDQLTVGASGCIMGLVGATGALMLRGWLREKALSAKRRLIAVFLILAMQTVFDSLIPQVSMAAHLSGALIGFIVTSVCRDRLMLGGQQRAS